MLCIQILSAIIGLKKVPRQGGLPCLPFERCAISGERKWQGA